MVKCTLASHKDYADSKTEEHPATPESIDRDNKTNSLFFTVYSGELSQKIHATCLRDCGEYSEDPVISRISVFHGFNTVQNRSHPFLIMYWSRPYRSSHVIFLPTVVAFLCHNWTNCW